MRSAWWVAMGLLAVFVLTTLFAWADYFTAIGNLTNLGC